MKKEGYCCTPGLEVGCGETFVIAFGIGFANLKPSPEGICCTGGSWEHVLEDCGSALSHIWQQGKLPGQGDRGL